MDAKLCAKHESLKKALHGLGQVAVAFSGGVDSSLLLAVAHEELGEDACAITGCSPSMPDRELAAARSFCEEHGIRQLVVDTHEFDIEGFALNPKDRCYLCKSSLMETFAQAAAEAGFTTLVEGSNADDARAYRPGSKALAELDVASPLQQAGLSKEEVRLLARELGLEVWNKPSLACLNTRFPYGMRLTPERLKVVDRAEQALVDLGFSQVRVRVEGADDLQVVRIHGDFVPQSVGTIPRRSCVGAHFQCARGADGEGVPSAGVGGMCARVELDEGDIERAAAPDMRRRIVKALGEAGFSRMALDLQGYRTGSMDEV